VPDAAPGAGNYGYSVFELHDIQRGDMVPMYSAVSTDSIPETLSIAFA